MELFLKLLKHRHAAYRHRLEIAKRQKWRDECNAKHERMVRNGDDDEWSIGFNGIGGSNGVKPLAEDNWAGGKHGPRMCSPESWDNAIRAWEEDR